MNDTGNDSCSSELSPTQRNILIYVLGGVGAFSTLICVIALLITCYYRLHKRFVHRLVIYQLLSTMFFSLMCALELSFLNYSASPSKTMKILCGTVGYFLSVAVETKLLVTFWLTFYLFMFAVFLKDLRHLELLYVITSIGIPVICDWIPFVNGLYGVAGAWCWIKNWKGDCANDKMLLGTIEQYMFLYAPGMALLFVDLLMIIVTIGVLLYRSYCRPVKEAAEYDPLLERQAEKQKKAFKEILPLILYPIIFIILFLPSLIQRIYGAIVPETGFFLFVLHAATGPSWGLFAGIAVAIHICLLRCCGFQLHHNPPLDNLSVDYKEVKHDPIYTAYTVASTNAKTHFSVPQESDISLLYGHDSVPE